MSVPLSARWFLRAAGIVGLVLTMVAMAHLSSASPRSGSLPVAAASGVSGVSGVSGSGRSVRYHFDGFDGRPTAEDGGLVLRVVAAGGGALLSEARDGGRAVRFPALCPRFAAGPCPRAILESEPAGWLNPGVSAFRYGAAVRLEAGETSSGENVVQKGYARGHSQFKLQIDGPAGRPSCVLVGTRSPRIHVLIAAVSVADGRWHAVECARSDGSLTIAVDGVVAGRLAIPASLSVSNHELLRIGGKGAGPNNDQFHGAVDDVFVAVGS
jgi:hypothetical protein